MATSSADLHVKIVDEVYDRPPILSTMGSLIRRQPLGAAGLLVVLVMIFCGIFAPWIAPFDPEENNFDAMFVPPGGLTYLLGTDEFGRDIFSRLVYGARTAMLVGFVCAFAASTGGLVVGVSSAYFGGTFDLIVQRLVDVIMAFPLIILALAVVATLGPGTVNVIIAITIPFIPQCARVVRSNALAIREIPYVDAARALGFSDARIILRHMAPNVMAPFLIMLTSFLGQAILLEASLSYLGMGVQEPTPAWGLMLQGGAEEFAESAPWVAIWPGVAISLAVFGFNLFGDGVRDTLDPKLRSR